MDQIPCFIKAYLIKACILMFLYHAPKIWLSRICKAKKSHPVGSFLHSCTVCAMIYAVLSKLLGQTDCSDLCEPSKNNGPRVIRGWVLQWCRLSCQKSAFESVLSLVRGMIKTGVVLLLPYWLLVAIKCNTSSSTWYVWSVIVKPHD